MTPTRASDADELVPRGEMVLTRTVRLERGLVWRLWTESRHLASWWGPHGFTNPECSIDATPGGEVRILMRSPADEEYLNVGTVKVADEPRLLVFSIALVNRDGTVRLENLTTVELEDRGVATEVTVRVQVLRATPDARENLAGMREGWSESLDRLAGLETKAASR
jgi:uncharacterized protein YndB with AHSA1/START domain